MRKVKDIMTTDPLTVSPETEVVEAVRIMLDKHFNGLPVVEDGVVVGIICQSDLVAQQKKLTLPSYFTLLDGLIPLESQEDFEREVKKMSAVTVRQAMTPYPRTLDPEADVSEAATLMADKNLYTLPVVEEKKLIGVVGMEDILRILVTSKDKARNG